MKTLKEFIELNEATKEYQVRFSGPATNLRVDTFIETAQEEGLELKIIRSDERGQFVIVELIKGTASKLKNLPLVVSISKV